jgi:hypothetical protein
MVPKDYRLEHVSLRLIDRLEGARRSYGAERAPTEFGRITDEVLAAAIHEYKAVAVEEPTAQIEFLRRELVTTFLPRYTALAIDMTAREARGFGLGILGEPAGRVFIALIAAAVAFAEFRVGGARLGITGVAMFCVLPFVPDIVAWATRRRHEGALQGIVDDMTRIQNQRDSYAAPSALATEPLASSSSKRTDPADKESQ